MISGRKKIPVLNNVNLTPLLDFIVAVIPILLLSISFFEYVSLDTSLPVFADDDTVAASNKDGVKLGLTVLITEQGFVIGTQNNILDSSREDALIKKSIKGEYDYATLGRRLFEIKNKYPNEWSVILIPVPNTRFEEIISTMDATREFVSLDADGHMKRKTMFPNVVLGGGVM